MNLDDVVIKKSSSFKDLENELYFVEYEPYRALCDVVKIAYANDLIGREDGAFLLRRLKEAKSYGLLKPYGDCESDFKDGSFI